ETSGTGVSSEEPDEHPPESDEGSEEVAREPAEPEAPVEEKEPETSAAAAAHRHLASELPGVAPEDLLGVYQSPLEPSWASVRLSAPGREGSPYVVYLEREDEGWEARRSILADAPDYPERAEPALEGVPATLVDLLYPTPPEVLPTSPEEGAELVIDQDAALRDEWAPAAEEVSGDHAQVRIEREDDPEEYTNVYLARDTGTGGWSARSVGRDLEPQDLPGFPEELGGGGSLPEVGPAEVPPPEPVMDGVPEDRSERVEESLDGIREVVEGYEGVVGVHVRDLEGGWSYGMRQEEEFFGASVVKVPIMAAIYRKVESGELSYGETFEVTDEDYAGGAGGLQWQDTGTRHTLEDYLWLMMTQSDNVATNVLLRLAGGPDSVNEVSRELGAEDTVLRGKVTDQRAAVPSLDNQTTPLDMARMLERIRAGEVAGPERTEDMVGFLYQNNVEFWVEAGVPPEVGVANKGGWIDGVYNDAAIVEYEEGPYIITVFSKYGPFEVSLGEPVLQEISREVWKAQKEPGEDED
nr:serine hydrolase [Rubrobacter sp.]